MPTYQTPGITIDERNAFSNSIEAVPTAVPAFIGYTAKALRGSTSLLNRPVRVSSLVEFEALFGGAPKPVYTFEATGVPMPGGMAGTATPGFKVEAEPRSRFILYHGLRLFFANGGGPCVVIAVGTYASAQGGKSRDELIGALAVLAAQPEPTMVVIPDAVLLGLDDWQAVSQAMLEHCGRLRNRVAILDVHGGARARSADARTDIISGTKDGFRSRIGGGSLSYGVAYYPWLQTRVVTDAEVDYTLLSAQARAPLMSFLAGRAMRYWANGAGDPRYADLKAWIDQLDASNDRDAARIHAELLAASPDYRRVIGALKAALNVLPPSAAIAGLWASVDATVGVWKAPANVQLQSVDVPCVEITNDEQQDLNAPLDGKAVNAIRSFVGRGVLVWGARTLDGNSQDWRYVNVRRTAIMLEQSIETALAAVVFEPNDETLWQSLRSMIGNFLTNQWKAGALVGATPAQAFGVAAGLGSTMTAQDIQDGILRVDVRVALLRPAEFIVISFRQQMQPQGGTP